MNTQKKNLLNLLIDFCNQKGSKTFSLSELNKAYDNYSIINIGGKTPQSTIRRLLQNLRDDKLLVFNGSGNYTLGGRKLDFLLDTEKKELEEVKLSLDKDLEKREYTREIYYRNTRELSL